MKRQIVNLFGKRKFWLIFEIILYIIIFSTVTSIRYYGFQTNAYDLGIYNQALHTTLFDKKLLFYTADLTANPTGSLFGVHFSPILLVILPFYAVNPGPVILLVIQSIVLALGAVPLYLLGVKLLGSESWGLFFSTIYLLNPAIQGINWYDFHPEAFLPVLFLFSLYFFESKKSSRYLLSMILTLMAIEFAAVVFVFVSLYLILRTNPWRKVEIDWWKLRMALITLVLSLIWLIISLQIIHAFNSTVAPLTGDIYWREIGANSLLEVPLQAVTHPNLILSAISFEAGEKFLYILVLFSSTLLLPVFEPLIGICILPWLSIVLLSSFSPFYSFGLQYPAFIIPFLFYAAVKGMFKLRPRLTFMFTSKKIYVVRTVTLCAVVGIALFFTPLNSQPIQSYELISYGFPQITKHNDEVSNILSLIPQNASVLTQNDLFPALSNRLEAYLFPYGVRYPPTASFSSVLVDILDKVDFIVGDMETDLVTLPTIFAYLSDSNKFGVYAASDKTIVLKRGYTDPPIYFKPNVKTFNSESLVLFDGSIVYDNESNSGSVLKHSRIDKSDTLFWGGPYEFLAPGRYEAIFRMKVNKPGEGNLVDLYISYFPYSITVRYAGTNETGYHLAFDMAPNETQRVVTCLSLTGSEFSEENKYESFRLNFTASDFGAYEFRGTTLLNNSELWLDEVKIFQVQPLAEMKINVTQDFPQ